MTPAAFAVLQKTVTAVILENGRTDIAVGRALREEIRLWPDDRAEIVRRAYAMVRHWRLLRHLSGVPGGIAEPWSPEAFGKFEAALAVIEGRKPEHIPPGFVVEVAKRRMEKVAVDFPATRYSLPDWLAEKFRSSLGRRFDKVCTALLTEPPCMIRVNTRKTDPIALAARLLTEGVKTSPADGLPDALVAADRYAALQSPSFEENLFEVQDAGSQRVAPYLMVEPGQRVLDACAGEGGKSLHLSNLMAGKGRILSTDIEPRKLETLKARAARADAQNIAVRLASPEVWTELAGTFDRVLIDAPCSGTGVLRRQPETKWRITPEAVAERVALQSEILDQAAFAVKSGGLVVYATCSLLSEENEGQVARFLARHPDAFFLEEQRRLLPSVDGDCDGFFMARLRRK
jgi:16S rRNA (cytosine967-C5)-methyltransferase